MKSEHICSELPVDISVIKCKINCRLTNSGKKHVSGMIYVMMTYEDRIREAYPNFSKSFARLADFILDSYLEAAFMTATELGHAINVDATTVVRFSQQLGYAGYPELLREIREKIKSQLLAQPQNTAQENEIAGVVETAMGEVDSLFEQTRKLLDPAVVEQLVEQIGQAEKIVLLADRLSTGAARALHGTLETGGFPVVAADSGVFDLARSVRQAQKNHLYIAFQAVQESGEIASALREVNRKGAVTAAVLGAASFSSAKEARIALSAYAQPSNELTAMILIAISYAIGQALRWKYASRYRGADQAVRELANRINQH